MNLSVGLIVFKMITLRALILVWKGPLETVVFLVVIYMEIGLAAVAGMAFLAR